MKINYPELTRNSGVQDNIILKVQVSRKGDSVVAIFEAPYEFKVFDN